MKKSLLYSFILFVNFLTFNVRAQDAFITTWQTTTANESITIPTNPNSTVGYNYSVDWGDGTIENNILGNAQHAYAIPGIHTVAITGQFPQIIFFIPNNEEVNNRANRAKLLTVEQWGDIEWTSMENAFNSTVNLDVVANDAPNLSNVTVMFGMFSHCSSLVGNEFFNNWDVSNVTDMRSVFSNATLFNQNISNWSVDNVVEMQFMFNRASSFNQNLNSWQLNSVENLYSMFSNATLFNQPLGLWNTSKVTDMREMFSNATSFNQSLEQWEVGQVTDMRYIFANATAYNQPMNQWNVDNVMNMDGMFLNATSFNQELNNWNVENVLSMDSMFSGATLFNRPLDNWEVGKVRDMHQMFLNAGNFNQNLKNWNVGSLISESIFPPDFPNAPDEGSASKMFNGSGLSIENYDALLLGWGTLDTDAGETQIPQNITLNVGASHYCASESQRQDLIDNFSWTITDGGKATDCVTVDFTNAFITTWQITTANESITIPTFNFPGESYDYSVDWGDGSVENGLNGDATHSYLAPGIHTVSISGDFPRIYFLNNNVVASNREKILSIEQWGSNEWTSMEYAFFGAVNMDVTASDTPNLSGLDNLSQMFSGCSSLVGNSIFNDWDLGNVTQMSSMFLGATSFNQNISSWNVENVEHMYGVFGGATSFNQPLNTWDVRNVTSMRFMFDGASAFNQPLDTWDVSEVTDMGGMFKGAVAFNQSLASWTVDQVTLLQQMFSGAISFNQSLSSWSVQNVRDMESMFNGATTFNQDISGWDVGMVENMYSMFANATNFDQNLSNWDIGGLVPGSFDPFTGVPENSSVMNFLINSGVSSANYDALLIGWGTLDTSAGETRIPNDIILNAGNIQYCAGKEIRQILRTTFNWEISDGGENCPVTESEAILEPDGTLAINDTNGGDSDDEYSFSINGTNLVFGSNSSISISGNGVIQVDANTVEIPLAGITNGLTIDGGEGNNTLSLDTSLSLLGPDNGLTLTNLNIQLNGTGELQLNALNITGGDFDTNGLNTNVTTEANFFENATLSGTGTINGVVNMNANSNLAPGTSPGIINTGNLTLDNSNNDIEVNGITPGTEHDQVVVTGTVTIVGGTTLNLLGGYSNSVGDEIVLINNDGTDAINGTFDGLAEGAEVVFGDFNGTISYVGGDGNDISLSSLDETAPSLVGFTPTDNAIDIPLDTNLVLNFDEPVQLSGEQFLNFNILNITDGRVEANQFYLDITVNGNIVTVNPLRNLSPNKEYSIGFQENFFQDLSGNAVLEYDGYNSPYSFSTITTTDATQPTLTSILPEDNAIDVALNTNITLTFDEAIQVQQDPGVFRLFKILGTGTPEPSDIETLEDLPANGPGVTVNGIIVELDFVTDFEPNTRYLVQLVFDDTVLEDASGNPWYADLETEFESPGLENLGYIFTTGAANEDTEAPVITCPNNVILTAGTNCSTTVTLNEPTATDNVSTTFVYEGIRSDGFELTDPFFVGSTTITWTGTDEAGNVSESCEQNITVTTSGNCWNPVGPDDAISTTGISNGYGENATIEFNSNNIPYLAYSRRGPSGGFDSAENSATVKTFNGTNWVALGNEEFTEPGTNYVDLAIDINDRPYTAYVAGGLDGNFLAVRFFNGTTWEKLGDNIATGQIACVTITISDAGIPYVGYKDLGQGQRYAVKKFENGQWQNAASELYLSNNFTNYIDIKTAPNGSIFTSFTDFGIARVSELVDGEWIDLGLPNTGSALGLTIALDSQSNPLVAYGEGTAENPFPNVQKFENGTWSFVGPQNFIAEGTQDIDIEIGADNRPYIVFASLDSGQKTRGYQFDGNAWQRIGGDASFKEIAIGSGNKRVDLSVDTNGVLFVTNTTSTFTQGAGVFVRSFNTGFPFDLESPIITCPDAIATVIGETETTATISLENPTATDNVSTNFTYTGTRSDGLALTDSFPMGDTTISWTATDEAGNVSENCDQLVTVLLAESELVLAPDGSLSLTDTNGGTSNDEFVMTLENGNLILSNNTPIAIAGIGVVQLDANTVQIPLSSITNGFSLDAGLGDDTLRLSTELVLMGADNDLIVNSLDVLLTGSGTLELHALNVTDGNYDTNGLGTNVETEANFFENATLSGTGTITGVVNMNVDSNLNAGTSPGVLNTGDLTLDNNNNNFEVNGSVPGADHDQVVVTGTVIIAPGTTLNLLNGYANGQNDEIFLIVNDGLDAIVGFFDNFIEGATVAFGDFTGTITYVGGDGNDLVLMGSIVTDTEDPIAVCEDITVELDDSGTATVSVSEIDNGSSDNEGIAAIGIARSVTRDFDQNVLPDAIFGSGNANGGFTVNQTGEVELGLRAKVRYPNPQNTFNSNGDGTYSHLAGAGNPVSRALWNFEWSVNTDPTGSTGTKLDGLTYEMGMDFDPSMGTDYFVFDPINQPVADHAIGNNATANGSGTSATTEPQYASLLAANNVAQNSWNLDFFNELAGKAFDPTVDGTYEIYLKAMDASGAVVGETTITVIVGNGGGVGVLAQSLDFTEADLGANTVVLTVVDAAGNISSCTANVTVKSRCDVAIEEQPQNVAVCVDEMTSFSVAASGTGSLSYQWQLKGASGVDFQDYANGGPTGQNATLNLAGVDIVANGNQYRVKVTSDNGTPNDNSDDCILTSDVAILTVNLIPLVSLATLVEVSMGSGIQENLSGGSPLGGYYSGPGVNDNGNGTYNFDPLSAGIGQHTITYSYENESGCSATASATVKVLEGCSIEIQEQPKDLKVCPYATDQQMSITAVSSKEIGYEWQWSKDGGASWHTFIEEGADTDTILYPELTKHFDGKLVRVHLTVDGCDRYSDIAEITWDSVPYVSLTAFGEVPIGSGIQENLSGGSPVGGTYSGPGVMDNGDGTYDFDPSVAGVGQHTLSYTYENNSGCMSSASTMITVLGDCNIEILEQPQDLVVCPYSIGHRMSILVIASGNLKYEWEYSIDEGGSWHTFQEEDVYSDTFRYPRMTEHFDGKLVRVHLTSNECDIYSEVAKITWDNIPNIAIKPIDEVTLDSGIQENLSGGSPVGGTYSGPGVNDNGNGTYNFDPLSAGIGQHTITYSYENESGCSATASATVKVLEGCSIEIQEQPKDLKVCPYATDQQMSITAVSIKEIGYEWQWSKDGGASWHTFIEEGADTDTILYPELTKHFDGKLVRVHLTVDGCDRYSDIAEITWDSVPYVSFTAFGEVSIGSGIQENLSGGSPDGGTYSGPGVTDNGDGTYDFDPSVAGIGQHTLSYTFENESGCSATTSDSIEVTSILIPDCAIEVISQPMFSKTCLDFEESTSLSIDVIANNNAALFYKWQVSINGADWVDIADNDSNILSDISFDDNDFDSSMAYRIMVSSDNGTPDNEADDCVQISSIATVYSLPEVSLTIPTTDSLDIQKFILEEGTPTGGVYFGNGVIDNMDGTFSFDPEIAGEGTHNISYEYTNDYGCTINAEATITVTPNSDDINVIINEFQPNPGGSDPSIQSLELKGPAGEMFSGWVVLLESDSGSNGMVNEAYEISGTFDPNGLLVVSIDDIENPSFTLVLTDFYDTTITDFDADDNGQLDADLSALGNVYDAIGVTDAMADENFLFGALLGGTDFKFTGAEPQLIFRDRNSDAWYAINSHGGDMVYDINADMIPFTSFDGDLTAPSFGAENPYQITFTIDLTIRAWPNPTTETLNLDMTGSGKIKTFELYDMSGKLVRIVPAYEPGTQQLDVRDLKTGIYILRAKAGTKGFINKRFIIRR